MKICCESGKVKVSYKIPKSTNYPGFRLFYDVSTPQHIGGGIFVPTQVGTSHYTVSHFLRTGGALYFLDNKDYDLIVRRTTDSVSNELVAENPTTFTFDFSVARRLEFFIRYDGIEYFCALAEGSGVDPILYTFSVEKIKAPLNLVYCSYPDRWQYFEVETPKFNARDVIETALTWIAKGQELLLLNPLDPRVAELKGILEGIKRFSLLRSCVVTAEQVFNPSQINIALGLEIGVLENLTLPFVGLEYQLNFWTPVPGFDQIVKTIQSPAGCPPPLIKLECCPEKGSCSEECPPGTCEVNCKGKRCCYDTNGKMVKQLN